VPSARAGAKLIVVPSKASAMTPFVNGRETKDDAENILVNIRSLHRKTKVVR
jgi:hypothetical protein